MNPPEPLPIWHAYFLACVCGAFVLGVASVLVAAVWPPAIHFAPTFLIIPAVSGVMYASRGLRYHFAARLFVKANPSLPISIALDGESGFAMITRLDGEMVSLHIPEDTLEAGPEAVMEYVLTELEA